tara:strand:- start:440 stop:2560 length:2121 start_codon:yes stop_codon:yes gene_type:complete
MAKISTYTIDSVIEGNDKLLGTDSASTSALATRNYTIDSLKTYINGSTATNITDIIPLGFALTVNREGTAYERALVRTLAGSTLTNVVLKSATVNTGADIYLNTLGSGQVFLVIRDYNNGAFAVDYDLADFAANSATWSGTIGGVAHTGTVTSFNAPDFSNASPAANDTQYVGSGATKYTDWAFNVTTTPTYTGGQVAFTEFTFLTGATQIETQAIGTLKVTRNIEVPDGDITVGTVSPTTDPHNLTVYGDIKLPTSESRIKFGGDTNNVLMSTDGTDLTISGTGTGTNLITNASRFTQDIIKDTNATSGDGRTIMGQNTFTAINTDGTRGVLSNTGVQLQDVSGNALASQQVSGNAPQGSLTNQGYLTSIKVDENWFSLPALSSGVAEALPGLSETLAGPPTNITTGRFFYGIQNAAGALFQAATTPPSLPTAEAITTGTTSITVAAGNQTDFASIFAAVPTGQNLYFVDSTYTTAFPAAGGQIVDTAVNIYLVVAYDTGTYITVFGRQGFGTINISTSTFNIDSETVKLNAIPQASKSNYLYYDTATKAVSHNPLSVLGSANGATYDFGGNTDVPVVSIDFDNLVISAPANGVVTLKQGHTFGGALTIDTVAVNYNHYILSNITADKNLTLPAGTVGDSIKITNMSQLDTNGLPINYEEESAFVWKIIPNGTEKIIRASELVLDASTQSFELLYTDAANGWVIN